MGQALPGKTAPETAGKNLAEEKDAIKTLIGDISHQTKTPIANLLLYAQLLEEQDLPPESREYASALEHQAEKLRFLIDALVKKAYSVTYGARNLRRTIQRELEDPIAEKIIDSFEHPISELEALADGEAIRIEAK